MMHLDIEGCRPEGSQADAFTSGQGQLAAELETHFAALIHRVQHNTALKATRN